MRHGKEKGVSGRLMWWSSSKEVVVTNQGIGQDRDLVQDIDSRGDEFWDERNSAERRQAHVKERDLWPGVRETHVREG